MEAICPDCGCMERLSPDRWRCRCGGAWEPREEVSFDLSRVDPSDHTLWHYGRLLGLDFGRPLLSLAAGGTPLVPLPWGGRAVWFKLEFIGPTASFKDRGTEVMINVLAHQGVCHVVDDSSGNAGASVAAYAARAGMRAEIFVPAHASEAKRAQIATYGAELRPIPGPRENAKLATWQAVEQGAVYASHTYHPAFLAGQQTAAWEMWEQLGRRAPDWTVVPVGQGLNLLGYWLGFRRLQAAGLVTRLPRLVAVQPARLAPLCRAWEAGLDMVPREEAAETSIAEGLAIAQPVRGRRLLQALHHSQGLCICVSEGEILRAQSQLAHLGLYVEPSSAAAVAALEHLLPRVARDETVVVPLTGSGLKGTPSLSGLE